MSHPALRWHPHLTRPLLLIALLGPTPAAHADDWPSLGLDGARTRLSAERSGGTFAGRPWMNTLPEGQDAHFTSVIASPAAAEGVVVYAAAGGRLRAVRETDGVTLWQRSTGSGYLASPAIWRGLVFAVDVDGNLSALSLPSGAALWTRPLLSTAWAAPVLVDGALYVATGTPSPRLMRLDPSTGAIVWEVGTGVFTEPLSAPAVVGRHLVVGETGGLYHDLDTADGRLRWTASTGGDVTLSTPLIAGDRVYALPGGGEGRLHALHLDSGLRVDGWPLDLPEPVSGNDAGTLVTRDRAVSSLASSGDLLALLWRLDDRLDSDGNGQADRYLSRELVAAIDGQSRRVLWTRPVGRLESGDPGRIPTHGVTPTPTIFRSVGGDLLLAVASSLTATLRVLDLPDGGERWKTSTSGPTRGSPLLANGRLLVATEAGTLHGFLSSTNRPPGAPVPSHAHRAGAELDLSTTPLRWGAALDPEGQPLRYQLRLDDDGEILRDWDVSLTIEGGQRAVSLAGRLEGGRTYHYALRASDPQGALSPWTAVHRFQAVTSPPVSIGGQPAPALTDALAAATDGAVITLGAGTYRLTETLRLPAGVSLLGAGPHRTILDARGLVVAVTAGERARLQGLTIKGAQIGVAVRAGRDVRLQNVILRNNRQVGLQVAADASAEMVSATVIDNGTGVRSEGEVQVRNALILRNEVGLATAPPGKIQSRYSNVVGNQQDRLGALADPSDLALPVTFDGPHGAEAAGDGDLKLARAQPTTDRGDPADDFALEPSPNGGRINIGAFGNTALAELSAEAAPASVGDPGPATTDPAPAPPDADGRRAKGGGGLCSLAAPGGSSPDGSLWLVMAALLGCRRRRSRSSGR